MARTGSTEDDVLRLSFIGSIARRRWRLLVVLAVVGGLLGFGASPLLAPGHVAVSKVLLQDAADEEELLTEVQIAMSQVVLDRTATGLGWVSGAELRDAVTAEVLEGNVIRVTGTASTQERAVQLTDRATAEYVAFSDQLLDDATSAAVAVLQDRRDTIVERIETTGDRVAELQRSPLVNIDTPEGALVRAELDQLGRALNDANVELDEIDGREAETEAENEAGRAAIGVLESAVPGGAAPPSVVHLVVGGALLLSLLGMFALVTASRTDRRLREADAIGAALGAPVLARVDVRAVASRARRRSLRTWLTGLLRDDAVAVPGPATVDPAAEALRYRRALSRLHRAPGESTRLLVLVPADDAAAHRAVASLAAAAAGAGRPVTVVTDDPDLGDAAHAAASLLPGPAAVAVRATARPASPMPGTELSVVEVDLGRPTVPESARARGAIVVLSLGSWTAWELVGLTEACADAGHAVLGAIVVTPRAPGRGRAAARREPAAPPATEPATGEGGEVAAPVALDGAKAHTNGSMMAGTS